MSWFRSSLRRRSAQSAAEAGAEPQQSAAESAAVAVERPPAPPEPVAPSFPRAELESRPLADLHALAREAALPRYRLLRRDALIDALSGNGRVEAPAAPTAPAQARPDSVVRVEEATSVSRELADRIGRLVRQLSSSADRPSVSELQRVVAQDATTLLVATDGDGAVLGALTLVVFRIPTGTRAWIEDVIVDESARGRGVGEALTREALKRAADGGARTVDLTSRPEREAAVRMYDRLGFHRRDTNVYRHEP